MQSTPPHPISLRSILILSSHVRLGTKQLSPGNKYPLTLFDTSTACVADEACSDREELRICDATVITQRALTPEPPFVPPLWP
jgi:hypothetical protein